LRKISENSIGISPGWD